MIIPGILENSAEDINSKLRLVENQAKLIQIDVADGILVEGKSLNSPEKYAEINSETRLELHLMVLDPLIYLESRLVGFSNILCQVEAENIEEFIIKARDYGYRVGLSIKLETPNAALDPYLNQIDFVQFMSIAPGAQGRPFEHKVLEKIKEFKARNPVIETQIDGHMNSETIELVKPLGVDNFIVGSAIFKDENPVQKLQELERL